VLRNIPACISPDLMHVLMSMGHGDEIVLADADFPGPSLAKRLIRADGVALTTLLEAILPFFPLDPSVEKPAATMDYRAWSAREPASYAGVRTIVRRFEPKFSDFDYVERFAFYERARQAFAVVMTAEADGNLILKKGPIMA
jgi:L-fucose mutarotase